MTRRLGTKSIEICIFQIFQIMIHNPDDFPDVSSNVMVFEQPRRVFRLGLKATVVVFDSALLDLSQEQRGCSLNEDQPPFHSISKWSSSSQNNCYIKCRLSAIYDKCKCRPYFARLFGKCIQNKLSIMTFWMKCIL